METTSAASHTRQQTEITMTLLLIEDNNKDIWMILLRSKEEHQRRHVKSKAECILGGLPQTTESGKPSKPHRLTVPLGLKYLPDLGGRNPR